MRDHTQRSIARIGDIVGWRHELRAEGIERRPSNTNAADRGYVEQGTPDKPPPSAPPLAPPHSQRPAASEPQVLRRIVTTLTPPPEPSLPPPSAKPAKPEQQTLVKLVRPEPEAQRAYRRYSEEEIAEAVRRHLDLGEPQPAIAASMGTSQGNISRWCLAEKTKRAKGGSEMGAQNKSGRNAPSAYSQAQKDRFVEKALKSGFGGKARVAEEAGVSSSTISYWISDYRTRHGESAPTSQKTQVSSPTSRAQSKPNGAAPPQLGGFLTGLDEYINQLVDARVEQKLREILATKSLMELMKG